MYQQRQQHVIPSQAKSFCPTQTGTIASNQSKMRNTLSRSDQNLDRGKTGMAVHRRRRRRRHTPLGRPNHLSLDDLSKKWTVVTVVRLMIVVLFLQATHPGVHSFSWSSSRQNQIPSSVLYMSSPPPPRQPRRMLKKRRRKNGGDNNGPTSPYTTSAPTTTTTTNTELRPLVKSLSRESGTDYWIDPVDMERERQKEEERLQKVLARQRRQRGRGGKTTAISKEKLWTEVKAPYQQNWIGYFSVFIAVLSMLVIKFPELLEQPSIPYPDL